MKNRGFTLLELSVVLTIIGLLAGGVVAGKSVMESAELNRVVQDLDKYAKAVDQFKDKYGEFPGDLSRATEIWGIAGGTTGNDVTCYNTDSRGLSDPRRTCNGNGDGVIESPNPAAAGTYSNPWYCSERFRAFQHLSNAGLMPATLSGTHLNTFCGYRRGVNFPEAAIKNGTYNIVGFPYGRISGNPHWFVNPDRDNLIGLAPSGYTDNVPDSLPFTPSLLFKIDQKVDDGLPASGKYLSLIPTSSYQPDCTFIDVTNTFRYNVSVARQICAHIYRRIN